MLRLKTDVPRLICLMLLVFASATGSACMTFVVGRKASATGHVIVGHNEDDWPMFECHHGMVPARDWPAGSVLPATVGCNPNVPQAAHTLRCYWGEVKFQSGDGNADTFFNEKGVFICSDSGGNSMERMDDPSLLTEGGVKFNLRRMVGERATSARDGVRILCAAVERYGYAPSARIYTIADHDEAWLVQVVHGRNYVAVRVPDDEVAIMPNLYTVGELDAWPAEDVIVSPGLLENAKAKGFWDGQGRFNFAAAYQGSYDYGDEHAFAHPNNTGRFRQAILLLTGAEWPAGKPFPFSVKPKKLPFSVADLKALLTAHNAPLQGGRHDLFSWSICSSTTIESEICELAERPEDAVLSVALGRGCEKPYHAWKPFSDPMPEALDESATAEKRLADHVKPYDGFMCYSPAPGQDEGRLYYFISDRVDFAKPAPLMIFLHGGTCTTPFDQPANYFSPNGSCMPAFKDAPFIVAAPSAPSSPEGSRWNLAGVYKMIDATIEHAKQHFNIDPDRIFLGGHSMGCYGTYHLGQIMADRFAGVWCSSGGWWETDFRAFLGTPVFIQHGRIDCSPRPECHPGYPFARKHHWCGVSFARAAHELMTRDGVEHIYLEHAGGHSLHFPEAQHAIRQMFEWTKGLKRDPFAKKVALVTPCGTRHPGFEAMTRTRWLELVEACSDHLEMDAIVLEGPDVARTEADLARQTYRLEKRICPQGVRLVGENLGGNMFKVEAENVVCFRIYLSKQMGDLSRPFTVDAGELGAQTLMARPCEGLADYSAFLEFRVKGS